MTTTARRFFRRAAAGACAGATVMAMSACGGSTAHAPSSQSVTEAHDSAWIDSAIALVGTQSGHDPVVKVVIDPTGATITTRHADSRVQRQWWVALDPHAIIAGSPTPQSTVTPTPLPTPTPTASTTRSRSTASATPSTATARPGGAGTTSSSPSRSSASATQVFPVPSYAPATPTVPDKVDNTLGNMGLGAFGDTQVLPLWTRMSHAGCGATGWTITATATWSGAVIARGTCAGHSLLQVNGGLLPHYADTARNAAVQAGLLQNLTPNQVARVLIRRTRIRSCPTALVADYAVGLDGPLHLRTTLSCTDVTTVVLSNGWLPPDRVQPAGISVTGLRAVQRDLAAHYPALAAVPLRVEWSQLYGAAVFAPSTSLTGRPTYALDGTTLK